MVDALLKCSDLNIKYGQNHVIKNLNMHLLAGEILSILGPSGCGKTTLLRIIAGLEIPSQGSIFLKNHEIFGPNINLQPSNRNIGMIFQDYALFPHLTVEKNILFGISNLEQRIQDDNLERVQQLTRLKGLMDRYPHQLSGGQQQRVAIARTLAPSPTVLLMDEPFSNLDASLRLSVRMEMEQILKSSNTATIFVTHDREEAFSISDRVAIMVDGAIQQVGPPDQIYFWPNSKESALMSGSCDFIKGSVSGGSVNTSIGPLPMRIPEAFSDGDEVEVAIRQTDLSMEPTPTGKNIVVRKDFRGDETIFWVKTPQEEVIQCKHKIHTTLFPGLKVQLSPVQYTKFNVFNVPRS
ncbi:MAG: ABC transporter ATP-binding protein [SAR202 cluster bacterium]|uniref:ABC transporter domain-containing protein n=1 Tax=marine metagenome TaxID=408172 RepID=A0A381XEP5_9ZZZZ|nr:ABC transporter ATP-binding protein [SAR202 cluster bacterium]HJO59142.1 ABC transporter ATP-binding protein [SAR202 cluster bacterium]